MQSERLETVSSSYRRPLAVGMVLLLVLLTAGIGAKRLTEAAPSVPSSFVPHTCPFPVGTGAFPKARVRCGFLQVPENRPVAHGRTIKLAVAVFKSAASHPTADPFIYLVGGPGSSIVSSMGSRVASGGMPPYVGNRDLILVDQRGTGLSQPSLACPEFDAVGRGATKQPLTQAKLFSLNHQAIQRCRTRLVTSGIDLNAYNTLENAADIAELWKALGYKQANVYGGSYGARLALQVMRDHPDGIRSVVIDAVADPTFNEYNDTIPNAWRALQLVFRECAAAPGCRTTYPNLQATFNQTVAHLQAHPIVGHEIVPKWGRTYPVQVNGARLAAILMGALYSPNLIPMVPGIIWNTARGDYKSLFETDAAINLANVDSSEGMYLSMECSDDQAGSSRSKISSSASAIPGSIRSDVILNRTEALTLCKLWQVKSVPARNRQLFSSTIPTLLLEGTFDPRTPPTKAQAVARNFAHSYYFELPNLGHGVVGQGPCSDAIVSSFLTDPLHRPNAGCIAGLSRTFN